MRLDGGGRGVVNGTNAFIGERVLVVGLGVAGRAAARVLAEEGAQVRVTEARAEDAGAGEIRELGAEVLTGGHEPWHLDGVTAVVASPGVPEGAPILRWAAERGVAIWSELDIGARLCHVPFVAVTGTNGKSTTTTMVAAMMQAAGLDATACGNIGHAFSLAAREGHAALAVEASSFQLRFHHWLHPRVSVLLNVAQDHVDWHGSFERYAEAKARVYERQNENDVHVGNADDDRGRKISAGAHCRVVWFRMGPPGDGEVGFVGPELVARMDGEAALGTPVSHAFGFRADAAAAAAAALSFGLPPDRVAEGLRRTRPLPHRGEEVARVGSVTFLDDSKATNVHAALHALSGRHDVVLIAGGVAKGVDLSPLADAAPALAGVVAVGEAAPEIAMLFDSRVAVSKAGSIEEAVREAFELAPRRGTVLLAPACASWDMFRDYAERGDRFARAARGLAREMADGPR
ncbi:MAG TPA: UDP-N-acetylmuramoyl-L-alanine--D-glutamate ligase [Actinomycetota bacterium]|jgi:UDP-N-acetylmuramoylalanine--D-glutamate ligase|nr:UDP-N-acetylmuramoyl-L-alanine--D-glutamate ligase [Actinomycetota bacterium]